MCIEGEMGMYMFACVCLERLECFGRRVACAYVYEEREMCLWQERKSCMGVCLYRKGRERMCAVV